MEVVLDVLAVVMGLLVLPSEGDGERRVAPVAAPRVSGHSCQLPLEVLGRHVMATRQASLRHGPAVVQVAALTGPTVGNGLDELLVGGPAQVVACLSERPAQ